MFHPGGGGYFVPTAVPQTAGRTAGYVPPGTSLPMSASQIRVGPTPRWPTVSMARPSLPAITSGMLPGFRQRMQVPGSPAMRTSSGGGMTNQQMASQRPITNSQNQSFETSLMQQRGNHYK